MAKGFELEGTIKVINEVQTFASGFSKREFVVEVQDGQYPQMVKFECVKDRTSLTDGCNLGDSVKVFFDIRGNEYNGRYFVNLNAWKLEKAGAGNSAPVPGNAQPAGDSSNFDQGGPPSHLSEPPVGNADEDDIPF